MRESFHFDIYGSQEQQLRRAVAKLRQDCPGYEVSLFIEGQPRAEIKTACVSASTDEKTIAEIAFILGARFQIQRGAA